MKISSRFRSFWVAVIAAAGVALPAPPMSTAVRSASPFTTRPSSLVAHAEAQGLGSHGLSRVGQYATHLRNGRVDGKAKPVLLRAKRGCALVDAGCGLAFGASKTYFRGNRAPHSPRPRCDGGVRCSERGGRARQRGPGDRHDQRQGYSNSQASR